MVTFAQADVPILSSASLIFRPAVRVEYPQPIAWDIQVWPRTASLWWPQAFPPATWDIGFAVYVALDEAIRTPTPGLFAAFTGGLLVRIGPRGFRMQYVARSVDVQIVIPSNTSELVLVVQANVSRGSYPRDGIMIGRVEGAIGRSLPRFSTEYRLRDNAGGMGTHDLIAGDQTAVEAAIPNTEAFDWRPLHPDAAGIRNVGAAAVINVECR